MGDVNELEKERNKTRANNLPTTMEYFDNLLGEQLLEGGGGGDFSTANLQIVNQGGYPINLTFATVLRNTATFGGYTEYIDSNVLPIILYKGFAGLMVELLSGGNISVSGAIENQEDNFYIVTGDCTITIS